ncbi:MAG TPA: sodium:calcium antiporter [Dokdonella sp.]|uniref:sodium:calcium antiporter n=1 Tax=Dokdonella sp. TaxID=2291710 RepID=UPI002B6BFA99|nr:sodium:calcium antiporter [Dokdonella sp.]HUD42067.1 sodium:calcium antiporter [Dokdonella sp.]
MLAQLGILALATVLLIVANDAFVRGVTGLFLCSGARTYGVALGATVLGAVLPALAVALAAAFALQPELALGSLIGGGIAHLALILGLAALASPLLIRLRLFRIAHPALLLGIGLLWALGADGGLGPLDGAILIAAWLVVMAVAVIAARREDAAVRNELAAATGTSMLVWRDSLRVVVGVVMLPFAAVWLVRSTAALADGWGLAPVVAGLLPLGIATALAGLPPALIAARRGQGDFVLAHAFAAALCVLLLVGVLAVWAPLPVARSLQRVELPVLFALAFALYPMMRSDGELSAREGGLLVALFALFMLGETFLIGAWT